MSEVGVTKWKRSGIRKLFCTDEIREMLLAKVEKAADSAGDGFYAAAEVQRNKHTSRAVLIDGRKGSVERAGSPAALHGAMDAARGTTR